MNAKRLLQESHFGPETMRRVEQAFDETWEKIKQRFDGNAELARRDLARAIMDAVEDSATDVDGIKSAALAAVKTRWPRHLSDV